MSASQKLAKALMGSSKKPVVKKADAVASNANREAREADAIARVRVWEDIRHMIMEGGCSFSGKRLECRPSEIKDHCLSMAKSGRAFWERSVIAEAFVCQAVDDIFQSVIASKRLPSDWLERSPEQQIRWGW